MSRPLVKICGVTTEEEIQHLAQWGVDFFGLVVDALSPWAVTVQRAKELSVLDGKRIRATLITRPHHPDKLETLIGETGVTAIQLGVLTPAEHIRHLRRTFRHNELVILQQVSHRQGRFWKEEHVNEYLAAGADFILIDRFEKTNPSDNAARPTIPHDELVAFRERHLGLPILLAGGVSADNVLALLAASGAVGIDVGSWVRHDGLIRRDLVAKLMEQVSEV